MEKNFLTKIQDEINFILEHEDGLSPHDKMELNRLLKEKKKLEEAFLILEKEFKIIAEHQKN